MIFEFFLRPVLRRVQIALLSDFFRFCASFGLPLGSIWAPLPYPFAENLRIFSGSGLGGARGSILGAFWSHVGSIWELCLMLFDTILCIILRHV